MEFEGSSLDHDVMEILIKGHTHREVDEQMMAVVEKMDNNDCTDLPALVAISDQEVEVRVDDYTDLPALVTISDNDEEEDDQKPAPKPQRTGRSWFQFESAVEVGSNLNQRDLDIEFVEIDGMDQKKSVDWKSSDCIVVQLGLGKWLKTDSELIEYHFY